jgi:hypothetical protein
MEERPKCEKQVSKGKYKKISLPQWGRKEFLKKKD